MPSRLAAHASPGHSTSPHKLRGAVRVCKHGGGKEPGSGRSIRWWGCSLKNSRSAPSRSGASALHSEPYSLAGVAPVVIHLPHVAYAVDREMHGELAGPGV